MTLEQPLDQRLFDSKYDDVEILGKLVTRGDDWQPIGLALHVQKGRQVIPPEAERQFAQRMGADTIEARQRALRMISHPEETHERIVTAANATAVPG
jgi:hypothetical protein